MPADDDSEVDAELDRIKVEIERVVIHFVTEAIANLREETPVDTGHARANWIPSKGHAFDSVDGEVKVAGRAIKARGLKKGDRYTTASGSAQEEGLSAILTYKLADGDAYIVNNVPYITGPGSLNDGHSDQAAPLFIESCIYKAMMVVAQEYGVEFDTSFEGSG